MRGKSLALPSFGGVKADRQRLRDSRQRMVLSASLALGCNLLYALYHGLLGLQGRSLWLLTMCAFYGVLAMMRFLAVLFGQSRSIDREYLAMSLSGVLLVILGLILTAVVAISLLQKVAIKRDEILMITIAAYTFYKISLSIIRAVKQRRNPSPLLATLRGIGYAEVAASILTLQRSMLVSFGSMQDRQIALMNTLTGAAVCLFVFILGGTMIIRGMRKGSQTK